MTTQTMFFDPELFDLTHDLILRLGFDGQILLANQPFCEATGFSHEELFEKTLLDVVSYDSREECETCLEANCSDVQVNGANVTLVTKDNSDLRMEASFYPRRMGGEDSIYVFFRSLTEQQQVRQALRESEKRLRTVLEAHPDVLLVLDHEGYYRQIFTSNEGLLVRSARDLIGRTLRDVLPPAEAELGMEAIGKVIRTGKPLKLEHALPVGGEKKWFSAHIVPFGSGKYPRVLWVSRDITLLMEAREKLEDDQQLLRSLLELEIKAREVVAYEIHDGFVQHAVGTQMWLQNAQRHLGGAGPELVTALKVAIDSISQSVNEARAMIRDLRPVVVEYLGLANGLTQLVEVMQKKTHTPIRFLCENPPPLMLRLLEAQVLRIVQESLNNVIRHSQAKEATVLLEANETTLRVEISDNGVGFDTSRTPDGRYGLEGIHRRASVFGGVAVVESEPGGGTWIRVTLPVIKPDDSARPPHSRDAI